VRHAQQPDVSRIGRSAPHHHHFQILAGHGHGAVGRAIEIVDHGEKIAAQPRLGVGIERRERLSIESRALMTA
jgi:hypothetical protein